MVVMLLDGDVRAARRALASQPNAIRQHSNCTGRTVRKTCTKQREYLCLLQH
jgi:hypothetical protein